MRKNAANAVMLEQYRLTCQGRRHRRLHRSQTCCASNSRETSRREATERGGCRVGRRSSSSRGAEQMKEKARLDGSRVENSLAPPRFPICRRSPPNFSQAHRSEPPLRDTFIPPSSFTGHSFRRLSCHGRSSGSAQENCRPCRPSTAAG